MTAIYFTVNMRQQWVIKQFYTFLLRNYPQCMQYISIQDLNKIIDLVTKIFRKKGKKTSCSLLIVCKLYVISLLTEWNF